MAFYGDGEPRSPGVRGGGVAQDHHLNPTEQPRGPGGTVSLLRLSPSWVQQARHPRLWPGSNRGGSGHSFHPSEFTHHTLCPAPCWGLLTNCMFGRGQGGLPTRGPVRCGWGPGQGRRVSALSCPAQGSLCGRPGWGPGGGVAGSAPLPWATGPAPAVSGPHLVPPSRVQGLKARSAPGPQLCHLSNGLRSSGEQGLVTWAVLGLAGATGLWPGQKRETGQQQPLCNPCSLTSSLPCSLLCVKAGEGGRAVSQGVRRAERACARAH